MTDTASTASPRPSEQLVAAGRDLLLKTLESVARDMGFTQPDALEGLRRAAIDSHDELAGLRDRRGFENARGLTASRISLVHEEDLEFTIRINEVARRLRNRCERELGRLHLRYMTLLDQSDDAAAEQLPVGPETVCCGIRGLSDESGLDPAARLRLLENIETPLANALNALYAQLNKDLERNGVEPKSLARSSQPSAAHARHTPASDAGGWGQGSFGELHRAALVRLGGGNGIAIEATLAAAVREQVLGWLETQQATAAAGGEIPALSGSDLGPLLGARERAAADALEQVFRAIEQDKRLAPPLRAAIASLYLPMFKLALLDPGLLETEDHVARRLINAIGDCCRGVSPSAPAEHPLCNLIATITDGVLRGFARDPSVFEHALRRVETLATQRRELAIELATASNALGARLERDETALRFAAKAVRALSSEGVPAVVRGFLEQHWLRVLQATLAAHGDKSNEWRSHLAVADRLIWSVQPKNTPEERQQLLRLLPELLRRAADGLATIGIDEATARNLLSPCMQFHTAAINRQPPPEDLPYAAPQPTLEFGTIGEAPGLKVLRVSGVPAREPAPNAMLSTLAPGDWIEFALPDKRRVRGCVGWIGPARQALVICDPDRRGVMGLTMRVLERQVSTGEASRLDDTALFEGASSRALKGMRGLAH
ncbi:hypothetical protein GCM10025771_37650 [Niveibacterium umoris]|uniref:DUF1631 family protein n=1 Tax=Niveibacterium umoris TaxID=1193620 RepID=A0A840BJF2_9RHOO|nr:DUF1631 family protein [Niveibacterium umoris]MBB4011036.1 hypothetical protein [Niveibacterium umoris]